MKNEEKASISIMKIICVSIILVLISGIGVMAVSTNLKDVKIVLQNGYELTVLTAKSTISEVLDENNIEHTAEVITAFSYKEKEYLVYSVDEDEENSNIFVSRLVKDNEGYDVIEDIDDEIERAEVQNAVKEILSNIE